ncbi:MAG: hypothetical protein IH975_06520 [Nitrospinae bacterium]|nr:hypothetical protein [Nitrospinota bacterium]
MVQLEPAGSLYLYGQVGRGKTFAACAIGNELLRRGKEVRFQTVNLSQARFLHTPLEKVQFFDVEWNKKIRPGRRALYEEEVAREEEWELVRQLYLQLKKNYEEARDYPTAGEFHYGEMEMTLTQGQGAVKKWVNYLVRMLLRRSEDVEITMEERRDGRRKLFDVLLLRVYKALSGYGEKPGRALLWATGFLLVPAICYSLGEVTFDPSSTVLDSFVDYLARSLGFMTFRLHLTPNEHWAKLLMVGQAILGPIQLALTALALRRKFRR